MFYSEYINLFRIFILRVALNSQFAYIEFGERKAKLSMYTCTVYNTKFITNCVKQASNRASKI